MGAIRAEKGLLPTAGGFYDQAATWCDVYDFATNEVAAWRATLNDRAAREAEQKAKAKR